MKVKQFYVKNQFVVCDNPYEYFQSYNTMIAKCRIGTNEATLDAAMWDYSRTTVKYLCKFLGISGGKKEIQKLINNGTYNTSELN